MTNRRNGMRWVCRLAMVAVLGVVAVKPAAAQSTIFNIPSTDTVSPGKGYVEFDYLLQLPKPDEFQFQTFVPRVVVGVTPMLEVGANYAVTKFSDDGGTLKIFQPDAKFKFFADDDKGLAATAGIIGYIPSDDGDKFGQIYANVSKKIKSGARFTFGGYGAISYEGDDKGGVILGYEQPLSGKVSFVADFLSGKNFWGYFTPGISVTLPHSGLLNIGYSLGNDSYESPSNNNRALFVYYGITFP